MDETDYLICRCEEVTRTDITAALKTGVRTAQAVKMKTRAGMGICQGRMCRSLVERLTGEVAMPTESQPSSLTFHTPVRPVHLGQLAVMMHENCD